MKAKRLLCVLCLSILMASTLTACNEKFSFSEAIFGDGSDEILSPMTGGEWSIKSNREMTALITTGEGLLSGSRYVLNGTTPYADEVVDAENAIEEADEVYKSLELMYEPESYKTQKQQALQAITSYKNACVSYKQALESKDNDMVERAAKELSATVTDLTLYSGDLNNF